MSEKRKSPRVISINLVMVNHDSNSEINESLLGRTLDLSEGGVRIETNVEVENVKIYDLLGNLLYETKFKSEIDISYFDEGVYLLKFYSKKEEILKTEKIILSK